MVAIGDDRQAQAIEAGNSIGLFRRALGSDAVPELESTVRQLRERDRETTLLFRQGKAQEGIRRLREDGQAILVQGGRRQAAEAVADLWTERQRVNANRDGFILTVSAPTNADAREIAAIIRERRRKVSEIGRDEITVQAADQTGAEYDLPLAKGDRVRLFKRTNATIGGRSSNIGHNGSVVEVERIDQAGMQVRNAKGTTGFVWWENLRDEETGRVRLTYGDVLTIDAIQSATSTEHINALPSGSAAVHSFTGYVAQSRSREATFLVVSDGRERSEILGKRALGNVDPITEDQVWANVGANLARRPDKGLATDLLESADRIYTGTVRSLASAFQPMQQREAEGRERSTLHRGFAQHRDTQDVAKATPAMKTAAERRTRTTRSAAAEAYRELRDARRSMRAPAARPKRNRKEGQRPQAEQVAREVSVIWNRATTVQTHPYLARKRIEAHGLRQNDRGELLVPMRDIDGQLWSVQTITPDGRTSFWLGGRKRGTHALLGELQPGAPVVIAVGFAAAATVREATGFATIAALDSNNLMEVARAYRKRDPQRPIIIAADNDHHLPRRETPLPNVGLQGAGKAAETVHGFVLMPSFAASDHGTDWNDVALRDGLAAIRKQVAEALQPAGIELGKWKQSSVMDQTARDAARERLPGLSRSPSGRAETEGMQQEYRGPESEEPEFGL